MINQSRNNNNSHHGFNNNKDKNKIIGLNSLRKMQYRECLLLDRWVSGSYKLFILNKNKSSKHHVAEMLLSEVIDNKLEEFNN